MHLGAKNLEQIAKEQPVNRFDYEPKKESGFCEPSVDGNYSTLAFPTTRGESSDGLLDIVHSDVCGKIETKSPRRAEYFLALIDDKSRFVWVYTLKHKSEVFEKFTEWKSMVEKSNGMKVKVLRTDNGGEHTSKEFEQYLKKQGPQHELTVPKTPPQSGVAERMNKTLVETIRSMIADSELPRQFWVEALSTTTYLPNHSPANAVHDKTPYEAWTGSKPNVSHLRIFGCNAYAPEPKDERSKLDSRTRRSIFHGHKQGVKGCCLYVKAQKRIFYSRNVVFNEARSTKQDDDKDVPEDEPSIELEMDCQSEDGNTINHHADEEER